jgi:hypothetical protein
MQVPRLQRYAQHCGQGFPPGAQYYCKGFRWSSFSIRSTRLLVYITSRSRKFIMVIVFFSTLEILELSLFISFFRIPVSALISGGTWV